MASGGAPGPAPPGPSSPRADAPAPPSPSSFCRLAARGSDLPAIAAALASNPALASSPDAQGFYPLQWAALHDRAAVVTLLLQAGALPSAANPAGQTALHWSAARGAVAAGEALLSGAPDQASLLAAPDAQGYTPLHVAAQHDAPAWLHRAAGAWPGGLAAARAARDAHDRTPLHWAAYKGATDAVRLLLVLGADPGATDDEGATPLHWAALRGHRDACLLLVRAGSAGHRLGGGAALGVRDGTGATPTDLARAKGHGFLADRLAVEAAKARQRELLRGKAGLLSRLAGAHLAPLTLALALSLAWFFEAGVVWARGAPPPDAPTVAAGWAVAALALAGCACLVATARADPGRLPVHPSLGKGEDGVRAGGGPSSDVAGPQQPPSSQWPDASPKSPLHAPHASTDVLSHPAFAHPPPAARPDWARLCVGCRAVRPLRAKHCGATGACVSRFDHHCPWTGCAIGGRNLAPFLGMLASFTAAAGLAAAVAGARLGGLMAALADHDRRAGAGGPPLQTTTPPLLSSGPPSGAAAAAAAAGLFLMFDGAVALAVAVLTAVQVRQVSANLTTAEAVGGPGRHPYLRGHGGRGWANPFDRGTCAANWADALGGWAGGRHGPARGSASPRGRRRQGGGNRGLEMV